MVIFEKTTPIRPISKEDFEDHEYDRIDVADIDTFVTEFDDDKKL